MHLPRFITLGAVSLALISGQLHAQSLPCLEFSADYEPCMDRSAGVNSAMIDCVGAEIKIQDRELNVNYKRALRNLPAERQQPLKQAQRSWIAHRDANCAVYNDPEGGSLARLSAVLCVMEMTKLRSLELGRMADW